jgi:hypothetical protein
MTHRTTVRAVVFAVVGGADVVAVAVCLLTDGGCVGRALQLVLALSALVRGSSRVTGGPLARLALTGTRVTAGVIAGHTQQPRRAGVPQHSQRQAQRERGDKQETESAKRGHHPPCLEDAAPEHKLGSNAGAGHEGAVEAAGSRAACRFLAPFLRVP